MKARLVRGREEVEEVAWGIGRRELVFWRHDLCAYSQCQVWIETRRETRLEEPLHNLLKHTRIDVQLDGCARAQSAVEGVAFGVCALDVLHVGVGFAVRLILCIRPEALFFVFGPLQDVRWVSSQALDIPVSFFALKQHDNPALGGILSGKRSPWD